MRTVKMPSTPEELGQMLAIAAKGEQLTITRDGKPLAVVGPHKPFAVTLGLMRGRIDVPDWFDEPLPAEVLAGFNGDLDGPETIRLDQPEEATRGSGAGSPAQ